MLEDLSLGRMMPEQGGFRPGAQREGGVVGKARGRLHMSHRQHSCFSHLENEVMIPS